MSNIQRLRKSGNKSQKLFADTILTMKQSQGFYDRLYNSINKLSDDGFEQLLGTLELQNFKDAVDVIFWLEC